MILGFVLLYFIVLIEMNSLSPKRRRPIAALAYATVFYIVFLYAVTEVLSIGCHVSQLAVALCWVAFDLALVYQIVFLYRTKTDVVRGLLQKFRESFSDNRFLYAAFVLFSILVVLTSIRIVPYNWDSLSYHLPRIALWAEQGGVFHFPTNDTRMLGTPPLKEFVDLHIYVLAGAGSNDSLLNLTQSISYLLNILFVIEIADRIGCKKWGKVLAALLFASTPSAIAEAFSTQTDEFAAVWVLIFVITVLELAQNQELLRISRAAYARMFFLGTVIAFSYLAKPSGLFAVAVFTIYLFIVSVLKKNRVQVLIVWCAVTALSTAFVAAPELLRNLKTYGSIMDTWQGVGQLVQTFDPRYLFVNMLKNLGENVSYAAWPKVIDRYVRVVYWIGSFFNIDVTNGLISEVPGLAYNLTPRTDFTFDTAVNFLIPVLAFLCLLLFVIRMIREKKWRPGYRTVAFTAFFIALCFIKWEWFMARYLIGYFAVLAPAVALELEQVPFLPAKIYSKADQQIGFNRVSIFMIIALMSSTLLLGAGVDYHIGTVFNPPRYERRA